MNPIWADGQSNPQEHVNSIVQDVDAVISQLVFRAADGRSQGVQQGNQSRIKICQTGRHVHRLHGKHVERPVVDRHVLATGHDVAIEQTVDVQRQQINALGQ